MTRGTPGQARPRSILAAILLAAAVLYCVGISNGLPAVFNGDEPHLVNTAVSFGRGSLRPPDFKYPTLWMYVLFFAYGAYFAIWSVFGLLRTIRQFGEMYAWNPSGFYLIARFLSAAASVAGLERVYRAGALAFDEETGLWAAAALAVSPTLVVAAHAAKPDSFMFFLSAWCWWAAAKYWKNGRSVDLGWSGLAYGLAASTQFTALPLGIIVPAAGWSRKGWRERGVWLGAAAAAIGFFVGTPFALIEMSRFLASLRDQRALEQMGSSAGMASIVARRIITFAGDSVVAAAAFIAGSAFLARRDARRAIFLLAPIAAAWAFLSRSPEGSWQRYLISVFPGIALAAGWGMRECGRIVRERKAAGAAAVIAALSLLLLAPGAMESAKFDHGLLLPDTRTLAADWIRAHVPEGTRILLDQEHASPRLAMTRDEALEMERKTREESNPRARYYDYMASGHPGGGYWIYRVPRSAKDLHTNPSLAAESAKGQPILDVRPGLSAARAAGVQVVVLTSFGARADRSPELVDFLNQTAGEGTLLARFSPQPDRVEGPDISIYRIAP